MNNKFKVVLEAMIDNSSLSKIQKKLAKERLKISADIDLTSFSKNRADLEKQFQQVIKEQETSNDAAKDTISLQKDVTSVLNREKEIYTDIWNINKKITSLHPGEDTRQIASLHEKKKLYEDIYVSSQKEGKNSNIQSSVKAASELSKVINTITKSMSFLKSLGSKADLIPEIKNVGRRNGAYALSNV